MNITIITSENRRLFPAVVYSIEDNENKSPISDIDYIYDLLYKDQNILVTAHQYDQYGKELKIFNGKLQKSDIKALFAVKQDNISNDLGSIMTLSEAAKKWGLSDGSTIRKAIERGKFDKNEIKQAGDVWIVTCSAMERVFGSIRNEENAFIIYDDFETVYLTRFYYEYSQMIICRKSPLFEKKMKELEEKYDYVRGVFAKALNSLRNNQKLIIKKSRNNRIREVINTENEFFRYLEVFKSRRNLSPEQIDRLINDLKEIP